MVDPQSNLGESLTGPARQCFAITPSDTLAIEPQPRAIRAGGDGVIMLRAVGSSSDIAHPVVEGERIDVRVSHVRATGTTVTSIIGYR